MNLRKTLFIGLAIFGVLLTLSIIFYKERTVILDVAFLLFNIIKDGALAIQINRYGAAATQIFPLLGYKAGLSLSAIAMLTSMGFIIYYFASFLLITLKIKSERIAQLLLLYMITITTHSFFWIQCELVQGVVFSLIYIAMIEKELQKDRPSNIFLMLSPFFLVTIVFFYPLLMFVMIFALLYFYLHFGPKYKGFLGVIGGGYISILLVKLFFFKTPYDTNAMNGAWNLQYLFPNYFTIKSTTNFLVYCIRDYNVLAVLFLFITGFYIKQKLYLKLGLFLCFFLGLTLLINVSVFNGAEEFYLEPQYTILTIFTGFALIYDILPYFNREKLSMAVFGVIAMLCFTRIVIVEQQYHKRLEWERAFLSANPESGPGSKLIVSESQVNMKKLKMSWGSSFEFWLLSTMEQGKSRSIIIEEGVNEFQPYMSKTDAFITKWGAYDYSALDKRYFRFEDNSPYIRQ